MLIRSKSSAIMFLALLFLSSGSLLSLGRVVPHQKTDLDRCLQRCRETEEGFPGLLVCAGRCERKHGGWDREGELGEGGNRRPPSQDPKREIEKCQRHCQEEEGGQREVEECQQRCEEEVMKKKEREEQREQESQHELHEHEREKTRNQQGGRGREAEDPLRKLEKCLETCEGQPQRQKPQCKSRCKRQFKEEVDRKEERERQRGREHSESGVPMIESEDQQQTGNPYFFHSEEFESRFKSQKGHFKLLQKFSKKSKLLEGIENYRLAVCEANPNTFIVPHHGDAEKVVVLLQGKGTVFFVFKDRRESYNVERGDVIRVPAGITMYSINRDSKEKLRLVMLARPINTPGKFKVYFARGGENPESYYRVFSNDILETALNTPRDQLDKLFGQQEQGIVRKAPPEQLKALSERARSEKQRGHKHWVPSNLLHQQPIYSNNFGRFFEASPNDWKQLQDIDVSVSFAEIKQGALMVPHYNSKTTTIVLVLEGSGRFEMACPHLGRQSQESKGRKEKRSEEETKWRDQYRKISSHLSPGDIFIIPAGHPVAVVASGNKNLWTVGFGINAMNNHRNFLAGGDNIVNQIDREAKELSFNVPADLVEQIFRNQKDHISSLAEERRRGEATPVRQFWTLLLYFE